jgi:hypothetical protein
MVGNAPAVSAQRQELVVVATLSTDDIRTAVDHRRRQDAAYRHSLDIAVARRDESEIERLVKRAVKDIFGILVDLTFDVVREIGSWLSR